MPSPERRNALKVQFDEIVAEEKRIRRSIGKEKSPAEIVANGDALDEFARTRDALVKEARY